MNKQQAYFEKNIVPFRQKIRELESENNQLHRDKAILRVTVEDLECKNDKLQREIDSLMNFINLQPEERKRVLERSEALNGFSQLFTGISSLYNKI